MSALKVEFFGKSFTTPVTLKFTLSSATITLPIASSLPKYFLAIVSVITTELSSGKGSEGFPLINLKSKTENKDGSVKKLFCSLNTLSLNLNNW